MLHIKHCSKCIKDFGCLLWLQWRSYCLRNAVKYFMHAGQDLFTVVLDTCTQLDQITSFLREIVYW